MKKIISFVLVMLLIVASGWAQTEPVTIKLSEFDVTTPNAMLSDFATELSYIPLETHPDGMIGDAAHYRVIHAPGSGYIIYENHKTRKTAMLYGEDGKYKNQIGRIGKGPGEYPEYRSMMYDPYIDQWVVLTYFGILTYKLDGQFIKKIDIDVPSFESYPDFSSMVSLNDELWAIYYTVQKGIDLKEIGVIVINRKGDLKHKWDLSDTNYPSTIGRNFSGTYLINNKGTLYFSHYPGYKTEKLNGDDWEVAYFIEPPFKKVPLEYYTSAVSNQKRNYFEIENGYLSHAIPYGKYIFVRGAFKRKVFQVYYEPETAKVYTYTWDSEFNKRGGGITNDIDENFPIRFGRPDEDGYSYELVGAEPILDFKERGLLNLDGKRYGKHLSLAEAIDGLEPEDNPVLVVIKMKE